MEKVRQINNLIIKQKKEEEVPFGLPVERCFIVVAPDGKVLEDNLTKEEAIDFCQEVTDFVRK